MNHPVRNIAASIRARLRNYAQTQPETFDLILSRYASERFLFRLGMSKVRDQLVLKGAGLYAVWGGTMRRPTRDLDFTARGSTDEGAARAMVAEICALPSDDGITFDLSELTIKTIREETDYGGLRVTLAALLDGAVIPVRLDIGLGDAISPAARDVEYPTMLDGPRPKIRAYPNETVVAEKCHAFTVLAEQNSRYKDFYDIYAVSEQFSFNGNVLERAVRATFERRRTPILAQSPVALTARFYRAPEREAQWLAYLTRNALSQIPGDFSHVGDRVISFLRPVHASIADGSSFTSHWNPGGPWRSAT